MAKYAAFLRAVNLGNTRKVSGAQLRELFEGLGFDEVASFRTSGNVVFATGENTKLRERIEAELERQLGYNVVVYIRTEKELLALVQDRPFEPSQLAGTNGKIQVDLLHKKPAKGVRDKVLALATEDDLLAFGQRELYWLPRAGTMDSDLDQKAISKLLGPTTRRTKGTIEQLAQKFLT